MIVLWIFLGLIGLLVLYLLFLFILSLFIKEKYYTKDSRFFRGLIVFNSRIALKVCGVKIILTGKEKLNGIGKFLLVSNHRSNYDPIVMWCALDEFKLAFLSKKENFGIPIFGRMIRKCCFMDIDRENPRNAIKTIRASSDLLKTGDVSVAVFPEGTRSKCAEMLPFHDGVFKIAQQACVPIAVVTVRETEKVAKRAPWRRTKVFIDIVDIIGVDMVKESNSHQLADMAKEKMQTFIEENK